MAFSKARRLSDFIAADGTVPATKFATGTITSDHIADTGITHADLHTNMDLTSKTVLVANASTGDSDTTAANTAFVQQEIAALVDSSPSALNTLNELAAALGDDANFSTTVTNSIATKLPLAGGTMTGNIQITKLSPKISMTSTGSGDSELYFQTASNGRGIYLDESDSNKLKIYDGSGKGTAGEVVIDNSGNVGIGATSPTNHINTGTFFKPDSNGKFLTLNGGANGSFIMLESSTTTDNDQIGGIYWNRTQGQGDAHKQVAGIDVIQDAYAPNNVLEGGTLRFFTKPSGSGSNTSRMVIDSDGNVGIGIDTPSHRLHIQGDTNDLARVRVTNTSSGQASLDLSNSEGYFRTYTDAGEYRIYDQTDSTNRFTIDTNGNAFFNGGISAGAAGISTQDHRVPAGAGYITYSPSNGASDALYVRKYGTVQQLFNNDGIQFPNGVVRVNTTTTAWVDSNDKFITNGRGVFRGYGHNPLALGRYNSSGSAGEAGDMLAFLYGGQGVGSISITTNSTQYNTTSDVRLKDNIKTIVDGSSKIMAMNPVSHTWKANPTEDAVHGFIAQEMKAIVPESVTGEPEGEEMMQMDYGRITPVIVAGLQDALKEIEKLKERINELENK